MARGGVAERAPLLASTVAVDCELGNGTVDRDDAARARTARGRGETTTRRRAAWVLGGCAVVAGAAACALGTRASGGSLMAWTSALGTKSENTAARRRARAVQHRREAARERRAEERRALEDRANDVLREIAREASPEDARKMVEEAIRRVEITRKSEAFAHAYDMARLGDEELGDDLEVDPHTIMDPKEFAKLTVDEKNALRRRMRTALRKVRDELKTNAPSGAQANRRQAAAKRPGGNVAAANAAAAKRRRDAADATVRAKGEEKRKEITKDADTLIQEIREGVEKTSSALREAAKEEGTKDAADKAEKDIAQLVRATNERIELIQKKTESRLSLIDAVTERHLSGRTSAATTTKNAVTKSKPTVDANADSAEERQAARAETRENMQAEKLKERERDQAKKARDHDHDHDRGEDDHADVGGRERAVADEDSAAARQRKREEVRDKERAHKEMLKEREDELLKAREMRQEARKRDDGDHANVGKSGRDEKRKASADAAAERQRTRDEIREKEQAKKEAKEEKLRERETAREKARESKQAKREEDSNKDSENDEDEHSDDDEDEATSVQEQRRALIEDAAARRAKLPTKRRTTMPRRTFPHSRTALMGEEEQEYADEYDKLVAALSEANVDDIERDAKEKERRQEAEIAEEAAKVTELKTENRRAEREAEREAEEELKAKRVKEQRAKEALQREETITRLQESIAEEKSKHVKTKNFIGTIDERLQQFETVNDEFQKTLDAFEEQMKNLTVAQKKMEREREHDTDSEGSRFTALQERINELNGKLVEWQKKQDEENKTDQLDDDVVAKQTKALQEQLDSLNVKIETWQTAQKKATENSADEAAYKALQQRVDELTSKFDVLEDEDEDEDADDSEYDALQRRLAELTRKLDNIDSASAGTSSMSMTTQTARIGAEAREYGALQTGINDLSTKINAWELKRNLGQEPSKRVQSEALQSRIDALTSKIEGMEKKKSQAKDADENAKSRALEDRLDALMTKINAFEAKKSDAEDADDDAKSKAIEDQLDALMRKIDDMENKKDQAGEDAKTKALEDHIDAVMHKLEDMEMKRTQEQASKTNDAQTNSLFQSRVDELADILNKTIAEDANEDVEVEAMRDRIYALTDKVTAEEKTQTEDVAAVKAEQDAIQTRMTEMAKSLQEEDAEREQQRQTVAAAQNKALQARVDELLSRLEQTNAKVSSEDADDESENQAMQARVDEMAARMNATDIKVSVEDEEDEAENTALQARVDELTRKLDDTNNKVNSDDSLDELQSKALEARVKELGAELNETNAKLILEDDEVKSENEALKARVDALTEKLAALDARQNQQQRAESADDSQDDALAARVEALSDKLNDSGAYPASYPASAYPTSTRDDAEKDALKARVDELTEKLEDEETEQREAAAKSENDALKARVDELTEKLEDEETEKREAAEKSENDALKARVDDLTEKLTAANAEREAAKREASEQREAAEKSALESEIKTLAEEVEDVEQSEERDAMDAALVRKQEEADEDSAMNAVKTRLQKLASEVSDVKSLRARAEENIADEVRAETRKDTDDDAVTGLSTQINDLEEELGSLRQMHSQSLADRAARALAEKQSEEQAELSDDIQDAKEINALKDRIDELMGTIRDLEDEIASEPADQKHFFDPELYRKRPDGLDADFGSPHDPARESGVYYACDQPNQCMTSVTMLTHDNKLLGMKGVCGSGSKATDVHSGGYDAFPRTSSVDFSGNQCKVEFADDSRTLFVHSEDEAIVGVSKDGSENTECGRHTAVAAASAIKYQCTNPKACIIGYYVKNSYKNLDSPHVEEDMTIQKVDFICSDGQFAVDPVTVRHDYGEISLEPEFSVKVANTPQADGTIKRIVTPYLRLKTNTVVSGTFLMAVRIRDVTALAPADRQGWCTQQKVQAHLNAAKTCREGSKLCAKTTFVYNPLGAEFVLKYGEQSFDLLNGDAHESSRIAIENRKDGMSSANAYSLHKIPMRPDEEFFKFGRSYEVCAAAIEQSKFKTNIYDQSTGQVKESFYNRHLDGSARFIGSHSRAGGMQGGPRHFTATAPAAPTMAQMSALDCEKCQVSGGAQPIAADDQHQNLDGYPTKPPSASASPADAAEEKTHAASIRERLEEKFLKSHA